MRVACIDPDRLACRLGDLLGDLGVLVALNCGAQAKPRYDGRDGGSGMPRATASARARRQAHGSRQLDGATGRGPTSPSGRGFPRQAAGRASRPRRRPIQSSNQALGAGGGNGGGTAPAPVPASDPPPDSPRGGSSAAVATPPCMRRHAETREKHREQSRPPLTGREQTRQADLKCCEEKERQKQRGGNQHPLAEVRSLASRIHCLGL